jgi:hypothetical protein
MSDHKQTTVPSAGIRSAKMPKVTAGATRAALAELIKRTNQTPVRITDRG